MRKFYLPEGGYGETGFMKKIIIFVSFVLIFLGVSAYMNMGEIKDAFIRSPFARLYVEHLRDGKSVDADHLVTYLDNGMPIVVNKHDQCVCWFVRLTGHWDSNETKVLKKIIKKDFKIIEVGANFGVHTLTMADLVGNEGKIHAFEANPHVSKYLKTSIEMNNLSKVITLHEKAAGDKAGEVHLQFGLENIGGGHLVKSDAEHSVATKMVRLDDELGIQNIDMLKIDAEGCEGKILAGAKNLLDKNASSIILMMEWDQNLLKAQNTSPEDVISILKSYGFKVWKVGKKRNNEPLLVPISCDELGKLLVGDIIASRQNLEG